MKQFSKKNDLLSLYNLAHLYLYENPIDNSIDKAIELFLKLFLKSLLMGFDKTI